MMLMSFSGRIWIRDQTVKWNGAVHQVRIKNGVCLFLGIYSKNLKTCPQINHWTQLLLVPGDRNFRQDIWVISPLANLWCPKSQIPNLWLQCPKCLLLPFLITIPSGTSDHRTILSALHFPDTYPCSHYSFSLCWILCLHLNISRQFWEAFSDASRQKGISLFLLHILYSFPIIIPELASASLLNGTFL